MAGAITLCREKNCCVLAAVCVKVNAAVYVSFIESNVRLERANRLTIIHDNARPGNSNFSQIST